MLDRIAEGDRAAFETLYRQVYPKLSRFVLRLTSRQDLVEEIVNDTMLAVWRQAGSFEARSRVRTWIIGIAYRQALRRLEKLKRDPAMLSVEDVEIPDIERLDRYLEAKERRRRLQQAMARLPATHRAVVELTLFHGHSYREIATMIDCPEGTVKTRMFHARNQLKKWLAHPRPTSQTQPEETER